MPSNKSHRVNERRRERNKPARSRARSTVAAARNSIEKEPGSPATSNAVNVAVKALAKAASKGVLHPNNASRRISRLVKAANKASRIST